MHVAWPFKEMPQNNTCTPPPAPLVLCKEREGRVTLAKGNAPPQQLCTATLKVLCKASLESNRHTECTSVKSVRVTTRVTLKR